MLPWDIYYDVFSSPGPEQLLTTMSTTFEALHRDGGYQDKDDAAVHESPNRLLARPDHHLSGGEWNDILNAGAHGGKAFLEVFTHNVHAKHSFLGLIFNSMYFLGGMAILMPQLISPITGQDFITLSKTLGGALANGTSGQAISSGFTLAKGVTAAFEALLDGRDSWVIKGLDSLAQDPSDAIILSGLAVAIGFGMVNCPVPGLQEKLREELGTVPQLGLGFVGAKTVAVLVELLAKLKAGDTSVLQIDEPQSDRAKLIFQLESHRCDMVHVQYWQRREWFEQISMQYKNDEYLLSYAKSVLMPNPNRSIFSNTLMIIAEYISLLLRLLIAIPAAIFTGRFPNVLCYQFKQKVIHDVARLVNVGATLMDMIVSFVALMVRSLFDIVGNEGAARLEGFVRGDEKPIIGEFNAKLSASFDVGYAQFCEKLSFWRRRKTVALAVSAPDAMKALSAVPDSSSCG